LLLAVLLGLSTSPSARAQDQDPFAEKSGDAQEEGVGAPQEETASGEGGEGVELAPSKESSATEDSFGGDEEPAPKKKSSEEQEEEDAPSTGDMIKASDLGEDLPGREPAPTASNMVEDAEKRSERAHAPAPTAAEAVESDGALPSSSAPEANVSKEDLTAASTVLEKNAEGKDGTFIQGDNRDEADEDAAVEEAVKKSQVPARIARPKAKKILRKLRSSLPQEPAASPVRKKPAEKRFPSVPLTPIGPAY